MKDKYVSPRGQAPGMELRDWFAGMAMQGFVARYGVEGAPIFIAGNAYALADAMEKLSKLSFDEICDAVEKMVKDQEND